MKTRGKKKKARNVGRRVTVQLSPDEVESADRTAADLGASRSEVLRRGLPLVRQQAIAVREGLPDDLVLQGDDETVAWKQVVIRSVGEFNGVSQAARDAGVTRRTVEWALERDPAFRAQVQESRGAAIEGVEKQLHRMATGDDGRPNVTAVLAILNAHHPDYGQIRTQLLLRYFGPFLDRVIELVATRVSAADLEWLAAELTREAERVCLEAGSRKK